VRQARLGEFRWGAFWSLGTGELRYGSFGFGLEARQARWVQLGNVPVRLRYGRFGMAIKVRCGVVSYNLKFLP